MITRVQLKIVLSKFLDKRQNISSLSCVKCAHIRDLTLVEAGTVPSKPFKKNLICLGKELLGLDDHGVI